MLEYFQSNLIYNVSGQTWFCRNCCFSFHFKVEVMHFCWKLARFVMKIYAFHARAVHRSCSMLQTCNHVVVTQVSSWFPSFFSDYQLHYYKNQLISAVIMSMIFYITFRHLWQPPRPFGYMILIRFRNVFYLKTSFTKVLIIDLVDTVDLNDLLYYCITNCLLA